MLPYNTVKSYKMQEDFNFTDLLTIFKLFDYKGL